MLIDRYGPDALIFSGVAGGLLPNMRIGDPVVASHLIQYDMDLTAFGRRHGELPGENRMIESDPELVQKAAVAFDSAVPRPRFGAQPDARHRRLRRPLHPGQRNPALAAARVLGAGDRDGRRRRRLHLRAQRTALRRRRGLSDTAGDSASDDFAANLSAVCRNCFRLLEVLIPAIGAQGADSLDKAS